MSKTITSLKLLKQRFNHIDFEFASSLVSILWEFVAAVGFFNRQITPTSTGLRSSVTRYVTKSTAVAVSGRTAQRKRRNGRKGTMKGIPSALNYLNKYRKHMDFAGHKKHGHPIGISTTQAGCKVFSISV